MNYLFFIFIFIFGSAIGSFLNVVVCRLKTAPENGSPVIAGEPFSGLLGRSHCPRCGQILAWYDLIPIISFFMLRGRCRNCREKISWQYPLVEIATGLLFVAITQHFVILSGSEGSAAIISGFFASLRMTEYANLVYYLFIASCLIVIFVYDLRHYIIPDKVLIPAITVSLAYGIFGTLGKIILNNPALPPLNLWGGAERLYPYLFSASAAAGFFLFLVLITRGRGMGMGDAKLAFLLGLVLGWPLILPALFLAFFLGAAAGIGLIIFGQKTLKSQIPFGPFLIAGALAALFLGQGWPNWFCALFFCG